MPIAASTNASAANSVTKKRANRGVENCSRAIPFNKRTCATARLGSSSRTLVRTASISKQYDGHVRERKWLLQDRPPKGRLGSFTSRRIFHIANNSDHSKPVRVFGLIIEGDALAYRLFPGPVIACHDIIDNQRSRSVLDILLVEKPSVKQGDTDGAKVIWGRRVIPRMKFLMRRRSLSFNGESNVIVVPRPREIGSCTNGTEARQGIQIGQQSLIETSNVRRGLVIRSGQSDLGRQNMLRLKSRVKPEQIHKTAQQDSRAHE